nr:MAG TPA: hypothetical protein [Caudoviricetes sp.]
MNIKLDAVWGTPIGAYNPDTANNGGGYWQFYGGAVFSAENGQVVIVEVQDTSCGDFGTRRQYDISVQDATKALEWYINTGSMDDASIDPDETIDAVFAAVAKELGVLPGDIYNMLCDACRGANEVAWRVYDNV